MYPPPPPPTSSHNSLYFRGLQPLSESKLARIKEFAGFLLPVAYYYISYKMLLFTQKRRVKMDTENPVDALVYLDGEMDEKQKTSEDIIEEFRGMVADD
jgi:hypothetical protein